MPLTPGTRLGPYEVLAPIGSGGMGEVYTARDTRLDRTVAIKVLPEDIAGRADLRARFEREARAVASLNHPHICVLHDIGNQDGAGYMVMEYLEGETLAVRIGKGALPLDQALEVAIQIADALDRAHRAGVTHRDLKPQNIMLTRDGVKVLDFGLAKSIPKAGPADATLTVSVTAEGMVMGTPQYMSPEQFEGKEADARSDIWAFGAVLYEMVTGRRAFQGKSHASLLGSILAADPAPMAVQPFTPVWLERLVRRCLSKDPEDRYYSLHDVVLDLRTPLKEASAAPTRTNRWLLTVTALMTAAALAVSVTHFREVREQHPRLVKLTVLPPEKAQFSDQFSIPAVSPDGRRLAFVTTMQGKEELWVRDLDSLVARALPGTTGAQYPFWSPDSRDIAFFADGKLKRIDLAGGYPLALCDTGMARGGTWGKENVLVWGSFGTGTLRVAATGGRPTVLTAPMKASGAGDHRFPWFLPDGHHYLYTDTASDVQERGVYVADLGSKDRKRLIAVVSNALYSPPGYLLFVRDGTLMAQSFDADKLQLRGDAVPVADQVDAQTSQAQHQFSISQNGVLAYTSGRSGAGALLTWFDRSGKVTGTLGAPNAFNWGAISPDGKTVAVQRVDHGLGDIWLHDLARGAASRFTFGPGSQSYPVWSRDGRYLSFGSQRDGVMRPFQKATGGAQDEVLSPPLGDPPSPTVVEDWSPDGRYAAVRVVNPKTSFDIWLLAFNSDTPGGGTPRPYLLTEFDERYARISPDGRWLAYTSNESKRDEIYVQAFPTPSGKVQVSTNGGERSVWSRDGKELYFVSPDGKMMAAAVRSGPKFEVGVPKPLFNVRLARNMDAWFDVTRDGRLLIPVEVEQAVSAPITVVVNWQAELKK